MSNKLRDMFDINSDYNKRVRENLKRIESEMRDEKYCCYCKKSYEKDHWEMGYYGGTDTYCSLTDELREGKNGQQCLFWEERINED